MRIRNLLVITFMLITALYLKPTYAEEYRLGVGDTIRITTNRVLATEQGGTTYLIRNAAIDQKGEILFSADIIMYINIEGLTFELAEEKIKQSLRHYYKDIEVSLRMVSMKSKYILRVKNNTLANHYEVLRIIAIEDELPEFRLEKEGSVIKLISDRPIKVN